jgi:anti-sigma B factor antagonist
MTDDAITARGPDREGGSGGCRFRSQDTLLTLNVDEPSTGVVRICLDGELDAFTAPMLDSVLNQVLSGAPPRLLVLDLERLRFIGSSGVERLVRLQGRAITDPRLRLRLARVGATVARALQLTGVRSMFEVHDTVEAALADTAGLR